MRKVLTADYDQQLLLPPSIEELVRPEHPARFVWEFLVAQDLRRLGLDTMEREEGGVAHDPRILLGAWLLVPAQGPQHAGLERACQEEMGFVWLRGNHRRPSLFH